MAHRKTSKRSKVKTMLRLADLEQSKNAVLHSLGAALGQPSFLYFFDHGYPAEETAGLHAFHASELPYLFGTFDGTPPLWPKVPATPAETKLSDAMIGYWSSFA